MTEDLSKALAERVAYLDEQLEQATALALAAERELHEAKCTIGQLSAINQQLLETDTADRVPYFTGGALTRAKLNLFHVKDDDGEMWVVAANFEKALAAWRRKIMSENDPLPDGEQWNPLGVDFVCRHDELLIPGGDYLDQVVR